MALCFSMNDLTFRERVLLAAIAYYDGRGGAFPSQARIAEMVGMPRQTVNQIMHALKKKRRLRWKRGHGMTRLANSYEIAYTGAFQCQGKPDNGKNEPMSVNDLFQCQENS